MNEIQKLVKGKPTEFSKRLGCSIAQAKRYSNGSCEPRSWLIRLIKWAFKRGYDDGLNK